jgi:hypothetical protein
VCKIGCKSGESNLISVGEITKATLAEIGHSPTSNGLPASKMECRDLARTKASDPRGTLPIPSGEDKLRPHSCLFP